MKKNKLWIGLGIAAAVILIGLVIAKSKGAIGGSNMKQVAVETAQQRTIIEQVTASGKLYPETEVKISSEVSGEIVKLNVKEGDSVRQGDLLIEINPLIYESTVAQYDASMKQTRANRQSAEATYKGNQILYDQALVAFNRQKQLHDDKIISDADYDAAKNTLKNAETALMTSKEMLNASGYSVASSEAMLKQASDNMRKTRIYAPTSGIISLVNVKLGERVVGTAQMAGTELIRVADLNHMQAQVDVNENDVLRVKVGDTADVEVDAYLNKKFKGVVTQIAYSSTTATSAVSTSQAINFTVKINLLKESYEEVIDATHGHAFPFRPGMSTTVDIKTKTKDNVLSVPIQSVTTREEKAAKDADKDLKKAEGKDGDDKAKKNVKEIVFIVDKGKVKAVDVTTGIQDASNIEITSGLKGGENVVKAPFKMIAKTLKDGDMVEVVKEKDLFKEEEKK